ncbi:MAG: proton-conducting transporter transmembrane domain-containing protein [Alkalilacustris sp.]
MIGPALTETLLLAAFLAPLLLAVALATPAAGAVLRLLPMAAVPALLAVAVLQVPVQVAEPWLLMGAGFGMDQTARAFLGFTAVLWGVAAWAAAGWLRRADNPLRFAACFLMAMAGNFGLILATDAVGFYTFFALMSFASYGLVIHTGSLSARKAGRIYIAFVLGGELALFGGLALAVAQSGTLALEGIRATVPSDLAAWLMIVGLGVKLGVMPLHVWLPPAHGAAPAAASAVLSGAMIKAGLWGMMALLPLGAGVLEDHGTVLLAAGLVTLFAAVLLGLREANPKAVLGFSSVAQMGLMALGVGAALKAPSAWGVLGPVLVLLAAHHALAKGALFLGAGAVATEGATGRRVALMAALVLPALVLAGIAGSSGAWAKEALKVALGFGPAGWAPWLVLAITVGGMGTTLLMARFGWTLWRSAAAGAGVGGGLPASGTAAPMVAPFVGLATLSLILPLVWPAAAPGLSAALPVVGAPAAWPLAGGVVLALATMAGHHALTVGPARLWARLTAPARRRWTEARTTALRLRRALRVQARRIPARLIAISEAARLAPAAPAAALAVVLAVVLIGSGPGPFVGAFAVDPLPEVPALPPLLPEDPHAPGTGLLQSLPDPLPAPFPEPGSTLPPPAR